MKITCTMNLINMDILEEYKAIVRFKKLDIYKDNVLQQTNYIMRTANMYF